MALKVVCATVHLAQRQFHQDEAVAQFKIGLTRPTAIANSFTHRALRAALARSVPLAAGRRRVRCGVRKTPRDPVQEQGCQTEAPERDQHPVLETRYADDAAFL